MKNKTYHIVETILKSNIKIVERGKTNTPKTQIHNRPLSWLGTDTSKLDLEVNDLTHSVPYIMTIIT